MFYECGILSLRILIMLIKNMFVLFCSLPCLYLLWIPFWCLSFKLMVFLKCLRVEIFYIYIYLRARGQKLKEKPTCIGGTVGRWTSPNCDLPFDLISFLVELSVSAVCLASLRWDEQSRKVTGKRGFKMLFNLVFSKASRCCSLLYLSLSPEPFWNKGASV